MFEIKNFTVNYGDQIVFENFSYSFEEGVITCILGESGSGKTTLLNAIASLIKYKGDITPKKVAYVFQKPNLVEGITIFQNLKLVCSDEHKIYSMLRLLEIEDKAQKYPFELSGGEGQRVSICRAFLYSADVLLCDEPFSSLDLKLKIKLLELLSKLCKDNALTTVFVTHNVEEALSIGKNLLILKDGKIVKSLTLEGDIPRDYGVDSVHKREIIVELLR